MVSAQQLPMLRPVLVHCSAGVSAVHVAINLHSAASVCWQI